VPELPDSPSILLVGIGNSHRGDDAAGLIAARQIAKMGLPGIQTVTLSGEATSLYGMWHGARSVVLIDAISSGQPPGTLHRVDAHRQVLAGQGLRSSSHALGIADAIALGRALRTLPPELIIHGVEGADYTRGTPLSDAVAAAMPELVTRIVKEVEAIRPRMSQAAPTRSGSHQRL
jgi:hydrogenase maturation protease